jgi:hypothetical protein
LQVTVLAVKYAIELVVKVVMRSIGIQSISIRSRFDELTFLFGNKKSKIIFF